MDTSRSPPPWAGLCSALSLPTANPPVQSRNLFCTVGISYQILVTLMRVDANASEGWAETGAMWANNYLFFQPLLLLQCMLALCTVKPPAWAPPALPHHPAHGTWTSWGSGLGCWIIPCDAVTFSACFPDGWSLILFIPSDPQLSPVLSVHVGQLHPHPGKGWAPQRCCHSTPGGVAVWGRDGGVQPINVLP